MTSRILRFLLLLLSRGLIPLGSSWKERRPSWRWIRPTWFEPLAHGGVRGSQDRSQAEGPSRQLALPSPGPHASRFCCRHCPGHRPYASRPQHPSGGKSSLVFVQLVIVVVPCLLLMMLLHPLACLFAFFVYLIIVILPVLTVSPCFCFVNLFSTLLAFVVCLLPVLLLRSFVPVIRQLVPHCVVS